MAIDKFVPSVISMRSRMPISCASGAHAMCPSCHMSNQLAGRLVRVHTVRVFCV